MKIIITEYPESPKSSAYCEVTVRDNIGINQFVFTYDTREQCDAFVNGFNTCQSVINGLVQQLPHRAERVKGESKYWTKDQSTLVATTY